MADTQLIAVDQTLAFVPQPIPQPLIDAFSYTTTFAQAYARTVNSDPSTPDYFNAMSSEFQKLAWNVTEATKVDYSQQASRITPAAIVASIIDPFLTADQQKQLQGILDAIKQPSADVTNFMTFWKNKGNTHANQFSMAVGPLTEVNNSSNVTMVYYSFNFDASDTRTLFVERSSADLQVNAYHLEMNLNLDLYNGIKDGIISKIAGKEAAHIQDTTLDI